MTLGSTVRQWLTALATAGGVYIALRVMRRILVLKLGAMAQHTATKLDDMVVALVSRTHGSFLFAVAAWFGSQFLAPATDAQPTLHVVVLLASVFQAALWGNTLIKGGVEWQVGRLKLEHPAQATTVQVVVFLVRVAFFSILLLLALDNLGINVSALVTSLGIGGIAIALAVQNVLGDLFGSLSIVLDQPFVVGDFIVTGDHAGTVEHIGLKTTRVRSLSGEQLVFANGDLLKSRIHNYKRMDERRILFGIGVIYETPPAQLAGIPAMLKEIVSAQADVRFDRAHLKGFGDSSLDFEVVYFVLSPDYNKYMDVQQAITLEIFRRFTDAGLSFAYPTRTVYLQKTVGEEVEGRGPPTLDPFPRPSTTPCPSAHPAATPAPPKVGSRKPPSGC